MVQLTPIPQPNSLPFNSNDYCMCTSTPSLYTSLAVISMNEWEEEESTTENDPDLEDNGKEEPQEHNDDEVASDQDDDEFEQYLFGDDE